MQHAARARHKLIGGLLCDKWRVRRVLGVGGMSTVYEAVHRNGNRVAIKMLNPEGALNPGVRRRFLREGYVANRVGHPGAVIVIDDAVTADGKVFLVMELLTGESLGARLRRLGAPLPLPEVLTVADRVLDVLACAHEGGIVHRDVKPDNVFVTCEGVLKLLDFGIASVRDLCELGVDVTRSGATLGTPAFMAPEQARGAHDELDGRTDVWSVGAMMFTLLTRRHVHEGKNSSEVFVAAATAKARSIASVATALEPDIVALMDRALRFDPADRWPHARAMQARVRELAAGRSSALPEVRANATALDSFTLPLTGTTESEPGWRRRQEASKRLRRPASRGGTLWFPLATAVVFITTFAWTKGAETPGESVALRPLPAPSSNAVPSAEERASLDSVQPERADAPNAPVPGLPDRGRARPPGVAGASRSSGATRGVSHAPVRVEPLRESAPPTHRLEPGDTILDRRK